MGVPREARSQARVQEEHGADIQISLELDKEL